MAHDQWLTRYIQQRLGTAIVSGGGYPNPPPELAIGSGFHHAWQDANTLEWRWKPSDQTTSELSFRCTSLVPCLTGFFSVSKRPLFQPVLAASERNNRAAETPNRR